MELGLDSTMDEEQRANGDDLIARRARLADLVRCVKEVLDAQK